MADNPDNQPNKDNPQNIPPHPPARTTGNNRGLTQGYILRDIAAAEAVAMKDEPLGEKETRSSRAQAIASMIKAWEIASDRIRIIRGRPLPGSMKPETKSKKVKDPAKAPSPFDDSHSSPENPI